MQDTRHAEFGTLICFSSSSRTDCLPKCNPLVKTCIDYYVKDANITWIKGGFQCDLDPDSNPVLGHDCLHNLPHSGHALVGTQPMRALADCA